MAIRKNRRTAIAIIITGIFCIAAGAYRGEIATVLQNAIVICLECIGIG